ncbi:simple sugar transport system permease protein [Carnobacterium iners]|uniref:Simple sugar transport system permease protein n=1 Tax=Carnobacterium iners TaxID=1073423 RepID=A0A1X7N0F7_9LACT|nr:ABC transporter permease [Carnobacterium iners]SEK18948.1 simple sugar transport system permease protein [Carnobacterium iners]SMH29823.1 simple sugar transport system permease protein [Carnobacterium iners]
MNETMEKIRKNLKSSQATIPLVAILIALFIGAIVMLIGGYNPIVAYESLVLKIFGSVYDMGETVRAIIPLILSGFAVAVASKAGIFNIGVDGQIIMGAVSSLLVGTLIDLPPIIHGIVAIVVGIIAGGLWGVLIASLKTRFGINEVISSIMLNYIALYLSHMLIKSFAAQEGTARSSLIKESASIGFPSLNTLFSGARIHWGFIILPFIIFAFYYFFEKTRWGYETKTVGLNPDAANYSGMKVNGILIRTMFISGALGGLIGALDTLGVYGYVAIVSSTSGVGFDGIAIALLGGNSTLGTTLSGILIGALDYGSQGMQFGAGVPSEIIGIVISLIIFFVAAPGIVKALLPKKKALKKEVE